MFQPRSYFQLYANYQVHNSRFCPKTYSQIIIIIHYKVMPSYSLLFTIHANYPKPNLGAFILNLYQVINYHICFNSKFYIINICPSSRLHVSFTYAQFIPNLHMFNSCLFTCMPNLYVPNLRQFTYIPSFMPFYTYIKIHSLHVYKAMPNSHRSIFSQIYVSIFLPYFT